MPLFKLVPVTPELYCLPSGKVKVRCVAMWYNAVLIACSDGRLHVVVPTAGYGAGTGTSTLSAQRISYNRVGLFRDLIGKNVTQMEVIEYNNLLVVVSDEMVHLYALSASHALFNRTVRESGTIKIEIRSLFTIDETKTTNVIAVSRHWDVYPGMSDREKSKKKVLIAVGIRRALLIYQWLKIDANSADLRRENALKLHKQIPLPEKPRCLIFAATNVIVGTKSDYVLIDCLTGKKDRMFPPGSISKKARGIKLSGREVLLMVDKQGIIVDYRGQPTRRESIEWSDVPLEIMFCCPYVCALLPSKQVEIHHMLTQRRIRTLDLSSMLSSSLEHLFHSESSSQSLSSSIFGGGSSGSSSSALAVSMCSSVCYRKPIPPDESSLKKDSESPVESPGSSSAMTSESPTSSMWTSFSCISSTALTLSMNVGSLLEQLGELVHLDFYEEALSLCAQCSEYEFKLNQLSKVDKTLEIQELHSYALFNRYQFSEASRKFEEAKVPVRRVFGMFERLIPDGQCVTARKKHPVPVISAYKDAKLQTNAIKMFLIPYITSVRAKALMAYGRQLREFRRADAADDLSGGLLVPSAVDDQKKGISALAGLGILKPDSPRGRPSLNKPTALSSADSHQLFTGELAHLDTEKDNSEHEWPLLELIDTMYLKCLMIADPPLVAVFLQGKSNHCNVEECATVLKRRGMYMDMVHLYKTHEKHNDALTILKEKCDYLAQDKSFNGDGLTETIKYLQELGQHPENEHFVLRFSQWVLTRDARQGLKIFSGKPLFSQDSYSSGLPGLSLTKSGGSSSNNALNNNSSPVRLPAISELKVLSHLEKCDCRIECRAEYLEMLIDEAKETNSILHNEYIKLLLEWIDQAKRTEERQASALRDKFGVAPNDCVELVRDYTLGIQGVVKAGTIAIVSSVTSDPSQRVLVQVMFPETGTVAALDKTVIQVSADQRNLPPELLEGLVGSLRRRLIAFLKHSGHYQPHQVLALFKKLDQDEGLLQEQAWLRSKIPQHREALEIIVDRLKDFTMAENYCDMIWCEFQRRVDSMALTMQSSKLATSLMKEDEMKQPVMLPERRTDTKAPSEISEVLKKKALNRLIAEPDCRVAHSIYLTLLDVYLEAARRVGSQSDSSDDSSDEFDNEFVDTALVMLERNHLRLDCAKVMEALPQGLPVYKCLPFLRAVMTSVSQRKKRNQIGKQLYSQSTLKMKAKCLRKKSEYELITDESKCRRCDKWLGNSAFLRYPNGNIYHYVCVSSHQIMDRSTGHLSYSIGFLCLSVLFTVLYRAVNKRLREEYADKHHQHEAGTLGCLAWVIGAYFRCENHFDDPTKITLSNDLWILGIVFAYWITNSFAVAGIWGHLGCVLWLVKIAVFFYMLTKAALYVFLLRRAGTVYAGSIYAYSPSLIRVMNLVIVVVAIGITVGWILTLRLKHREFYDDYWVIRCEYENNVFVVSAIFLLDFGASFLTLVLFTHPLRLLLKQQEETEQKSMETSMGMKRSNSVVRFESKLASTAKKVTILTYVAVLSTLLVLGVGVLIQSILLAPLDYVVNSCTLMIMTQYFGQYYESACACPIWFAGCCCGCDSTGMLFEESSIRKTLSLPRSRSTIGMTSPLPPNSPMPAPSVTTTAITTEIEVASASPTVSVALSPQVSAQASPMASP